MGTMKTSLLLKYIVAVVLVNLLCADAVATDKTSLIAYIFASATCPECEEMQKELFPQMTAIFEQHVEFKHINIDDIENFKLLLLYEKYYGDTSDQALKMFVGDTCLSGSREIKNLLRETLERQLREKNLTPEPAAIRTEAGGESAAEKVGQNLLINRFRALKPATVIFAGLIDGVNPCAFATIIFMVSLLSTLKKQPRDIMIAGICFTAAVFFTYMLLGIGALKTIKIISVTSGISTLITYLMVAMTLTLAIISLYDFFQFRRSRKSDDIVLKLPPRIRLKINTLISRCLRGKNLVIGTMCLGAVIALLESLCTGQVYLPTIVYILQEPVLANRALGWLLLYNIMFVLPLLIVFLLTYLGITSRRLIAFSKRSVGAAKLLMSLFFFGLTVLLLFSVL